MNKKHLVILGVCVVVLFVVSIVLYRDYGALNIEHRTTDQESQAPGRERQLIVGDKIIQLEVADTPLAQAKGLSGRASMANDRGMLFVFPAADYHSFWMKDMHFGLDMIWIANGTIVDIVTLPPPTPGEDIPRHDAKVMADSILELNAGQAEALGLRKGMKIEIR